VLMMLSLHAVGSARAAEYDPQAKVHEVFDAERLRLTAEYCRIHYGIDGSTLSEPQMIVLHYTVFPTLEESLRSFQPSQLDTKSRPEITSGGAVNVSAHYLVDRDGTIYQLASEDVICRHTIGFNYTAIGIENVGSGSAALTPAQVESDAALISRIRKRHPSIKYLIGHQEYRDSWRPHFQLYNEKVRSYRFTEKQDPGKTFLKRVRSLLKEEYGIVLKD
jgi:N-acetyl-anhydromuramyl-L-alanine amidase AmpD